MIELKQNELNEISGGISMWGVIGIGAAVVFAIGMIDGYFRPLKCH